MNETTTNRKSPFLLLSPELRERLSTAADPDMPIQIRIFDDLTDPWTWTTIGTFLADNAECLEDHHARDLIAFVEGDQPIEIGPYRVRK